ncbi:MAG: hypothetical protein K9H16_03625 [Bacteroidales bacterium]|nr:hypothetical protein [Bacteroidales bacterium]
MRNIYFVTMLVILAIAIITPANLNAQDCKFFIPTEVGTSLDFTFYNKKGKEESYQTQKITGTKVVDGATVVEVEATTKTKKNQNDGVVTTFDLKCDGGNFYMNMNDFTATTNYQQYEKSPDLEVVVNSEDLFYPSDMAVGQKLPDGRVEISVGNSGIRLFGSTITIKDRKVEAAETLTTPAGTFECLKISSVIVTEASMSMETKTVQWIAENVGVVKTENLSKDGKLVGSQVLTAIKK